MKTLNSFHNFLSEGTKFTYLTASSAAAATTLTVQSIKEFAINQILLIGEFGQEDSEIIKTHASTAPTSLTITLNSGLVFTHPKDTKVYIIDYDQVEFSHADTTSGAKSVLATENIEADMDFTSYNDSAKSAGYYFTRFKDSINTTYSDYSDPIPYSGFGTNTVFSVKQRALKDLQEELGEMITDEWLNDKLFEARRFVHNLRKRWSFRKSFNYDLGDVTTGIYRIAVPSDLQDQNTNKNVFGVRIGIETGMTDMTKKEYDLFYEGVGHTTVGSAITAADTSITLTDSRDFDESGTITIGTQDITYTANTESTGVLSGVPASGTGAVTADIAADVDVWQGIGFGLPTRYLVLDGYIYFNCPIHNDYVDQNIFIDYYTQPTSIDSDADEFDEPEYDFYVSKLKYDIKSLKVKGEIKQDNDPDYKDWQQGYFHLMRKDQLDTEIQFIPS